jgi:hypothetical protein
MSVAWRLHYGSRQAVAKCMKVGAVFGTRRDVIVFVANKLGGVHVDSKRNPDKDAAYIALDQARQSGVGIVNRDTVYTEVNAIGQQLRDCAEACRLCRDSAGLSYAALGIVRPTCREPGGACPCPFWLPLPTCHLQSLESGLAIYARPVKGRTRVT